MLREHRVENNLPHSNNPLLLQSFQLADFYSNYGTNNCKHAYRNELQILVESNIDESELTLLLFVGSGGMIYQGVVLEMMNQSMKHGATL